MMIWNCDLASAFEDGSIGAIVMAIIWGLWNWYKARGSEPKSQYQK